MKKTNLIARVFSFILSVTLLIQLAMPSAFAADAGTVAPACDASYESFVDALNSVGVDSSFDARESYAVLNGVVDTPESYLGSAEQNIILLNLLKSGNLIISGSAPQSDSNVSTESSAEDYTCSGYDECTENGAETYIVAKDDCPIRDAASGKGKIVARVPKGQLLSVKRVFWTWNLRRWAEVQIIGTNKSAYVYIENIAKHESHSYITLVENENGNIGFWAICGYTTAQAQEDKASVNLNSVLDQAIKGSFSKESNSFFGIAAQILVGEIPYVGTAADIRDIIGDIANGESEGILALDCIALIPLIGALKFTDDTALVAKHADDLSDLARKADVIPWGKWSDYPKVTRNGKEYAEIGNYYYTRHAVDEFLNPSIETHWTERISESGKISWEEHSRGVPPTYANWVLTEGVENGTTVVSDPYFKNGALRQDFMNGSLKIVVEEGETVVTIITK